MSVEIHVDGIIELRKALKKLGEKELLKELAAGMKKAAEVVAGPARNLVPTRSGRAQGSIRAGTSGPRAIITGGKKAVPYYAWLDFGTRTAQIGNPRYVGPWRRSGTGPGHGRFIYKALDDNWDKVVEVFDDEVNVVIRKAGLD